MKKFSIIVVCLNPGSKLFETLHSIKEQSYQNYEVIIKDGFSKDGSIEKLEKWLMIEGKSIADRVQIHRIADKSIYEAMNQAIELASGEFYYFLNCGDHFYDKDALKHAAIEIEKYPKDKLFYGNVFDALRQSVVQSNPKIDAFACYRHVPCHQSCIYHASLFEERGYLPEYRVRADYEHFLWCFFQKKITPRFIPVVLALYEGGGFSETEANRRRSKEEHELIIAQYMSKGQIWKYKMIMVLSLQPLRTAMAESELLGGCYQKLKRMLYRR